MLKNRTLWSSTFSIIKYMMFSIVNYRKLNNPKKAQELLFEAWFEYVEYGDDRLLMMMEIKFATYEVFDMFAVFEGLNAKLKVK